MTSVSITVDGQIDLIDLVDHGHPADPTRIDVDRARNSRLADVMIVVEREHNALEEALRARLTGGALPDGIAHLALQLDAAAPKFSVTIEPMIAADAEDGDTPPEQRALLEAEIAAEVSTLIEQRAVSSPTPRWQPRVTATYRTVTTAAASDRHSRLKSIWLRILFGLLASLILGTAYLYLNGAPT